MVVNLNSHVKLISEIHSICEPQFILTELIDLRPDGSLRLNMRYFNFCQGLTMTNRAFDGPFGWAA